MATEMTESLERPDDVKPGWYVFVPGDVGGRSVSGWRKVLAVGPSNETRTTVDFSSVGLVRFFNSARVKVRYPKVKK